MNKKKNEPIEELTSLMHYTFTIPEESVARLAFDGKGRSVYIKEEEKEESRDIISFSRTRHSELKR